MLFRAAVQSSSVSFYVRPSRIESRRACPELVERGRLNLAQSKLDFLAGQFGQHMNLSLTLRAWGRDRRTQGTA